MARQPHIPTEKTREQVLSMSAAGVDQDLIGQVIGVSKKTLEKHYRNELDTATARTNATVAAALYNKAIGNGPQSVTAAIFWLKTRARWRETSEVRVGNIENETFESELSSVESRLLTRVSAIKAIRGPDSNAETI